MSAHEEASHNKNSKTSELSSDVVRRLTEKLSEMLGEDVTKATQNGPGALLNDEGLPIIDITEPASMYDAREDLASEDLELPLQSSLPVSVRDRLKQEKDRILDQLEQEERLEQLREEQADEKDGRTKLRKRNEADANEKEKLHAAKEMQKKMGRALIHNTVSSKVKEAQPTEVISTEAKKDNPDNKSRKTVSFASDTKNEGTESLSLDWGDITPARLGSLQRPSLLTSADTLPMKMKVVERTNIPPTVPDPIAPPKSDSDDESDSELITSDNSNECDSDMEAESALKEEEFDIDFARHQREVALQYYEKRDKVGAAAYAALSNHPHNEDGSVNDLQLNVPATEPKRPTISQFKAEQLAMSYNASSPSAVMKPSAVRASAARTLQKALRTGKLDSSDRLVGGFDDDSEDENEGMQEVLDLIKKGELHNAGVDGNHTNSVRPNPGQASENHATPLLTSNQPKFANLPSVERPKMSRFKLMRDAAGGRQTSLTATSPTTHQDPHVSSVEHSPQHPLSLPTPRNSVTMASAVMERLPSKLSTTSVAGQPLSTPITSITPPPGLPSMIVESPSFPSPATIRQNHQSQDASHASTDVEFFFAKPPSEYAQPSRLHRPPMVMSSLVKEAQPTKVSRFSTDRATIFTTPR